MSVTLAVKNLPIHPEQNPWYRSPVFLAGWLYLDASGAELQDWDTDRSVPLCDPEACEAMRAVLPPPGEYLGGALLQVWVREGAYGPELHGAYWVKFFDPGEDGQRDRWGAEVRVRPVPHEYDVR